MDKVENGHPQHKMDGVRVGVCMMDTSGKEELVDQGQ